MLKKKFWKYSAVVFAVLLIASFWYNPFHTNNNISEHEITKITGNFLGNYILGPQHEVIVNEVLERDYFYIVKLTVDGQDTESFISKDGKFFFPQGLNIFTIEQTAKFTEYVDVNIGEGRPQLGDDNAVVTIIEFSDYQCTYCATFTLDSFQRLKKDYIDTGKVRFIHKHFPLERIHQLSFKAAEAALCAGKQGKFWEYHEELFKNMYELDIKDLKKYAHQLGLDESSFDSCLDSGEMESQVRGDMEDGQATGITGTPVFFINGRKIEGSQSYEVFAQTIEDEIARALNPPIA